MSGRMSRRRISIRIQDRTRGLSKIGRGFTYPQADHEPEPMPSPQTVIRQPGRKRHTNPRHGRPRGR